MIAFITSRELPSEMGRRSSGVLGSRKEAVGRGANTIGSIVIVVETRSCNRVLCFSCALQAWLQKTARITSVAPNQIRKVFDSHMATFPSL
jgi:uncharacterized Fe-S cluster-containing MiaB family protein